MVEINLSKNCEQKEENKYVIRFTDYYISTHLPKIKKVDIDCPDKNNTQASPDYLLLQPNILIEIKEVHRRKELEGLAAWTQNVNRLKKVIDLSNLNIGGTYLINTPSNLRVKLGKEQFLIQKVMEAIKNNLSNIIIPSYGEFKIEKLNNNGNYIGFGSSSEANFIDPGAIIHENISKNIETANRQLGIINNFKISKRIVLLVNKYVLGSIADFIEALSYSYNKLLNFSNIDEIWLQLEMQDKTFIHSLLYNRDFIVSLHQKYFHATVSNRDENVQLLEKWFYVLEKLGDEHKDKLFCALKYVLRRKRPYQLFLNKFSRQEMVRFGIWLVEKGRFEDSIWLIDKFIDDPDPEEPSSYVGDPRSNYHQQIIDGADPHIITTVLGHLAWVVQKLAFDKKYILKALDYTDKLLAHKNYYVKKSAIIPLIEIAAHRQWLKGYGQRPRKKEYKRFHKLVFSLIELVKMNPDCLSIANELVHVFSYYKDLSTVEAWKIINALTFAYDSGSLFIYFAICRKNQYNDQAIKFDSKVFEKKLIWIIKEKDKKYQELRKQIIWNFWNLLKDKPGQFDNIKSYIDIFLEQANVREIYNFIIHIIEDCITFKTKICSEWYRQVLEHISEKAGREKEHFLLFSTKKIIDKITEHDPKLSAEIIEKLVRLSEKGVYVENIQELKIFLSNLTEDTK